MLGVVLGTIHVRLADTARTHDLAREHGLAVMRIYPNIGFAALRVAEGQHPFDIAHALATEPGVSAASVEILEHVNVPL